MSMSQKVQLVVLGKKRHNFTNDAGELVKGAKVFIESYVEEEDSENKEGMFPTEFAIPYQNYEAFNTVPGTYEVTMYMKAGSKGQFSIKDVKYIGAVTLNAPGK